MRLLLWPMLNVSTDAKTDFWSAIMADQLERKRELVRLLLLPMLNVSIDAKGDFWSAIIDISLVLLMQKLSWHVNCCWKHNLLNSCKG